MIKVGNLNGYILMNITNFYLNKIIFKIKVRVKNVWEFGNDIYIRKWIKVN